MAAVAPRVLVMACSHRKHATAGAVPAWDLYDGSAYRMLKKLERDGRWPADLDVWILSAAYGLIHRTHLVEWYEQRLTMAAAAAMRDQVGRQLRELLAGKGAPVDVCVSCGKDYRDALKLDGLRSHPAVARVFLTGGGMGDQISQLRGWIVGAPLPLGVRG